MESLEIAREALTLEGMRRRCSDEAAQCSEPVFQERSMYFAPVIRSRAAVPAPRSFDREFQRFVGDVFGAPQARGVQVQQDDKAWTVTLDMPGVAREDLSIAIDGTVVRIATKAEAKRQYKAAYELPQEIDADTTSARLENGVLTLVLAKKQPVVTSRQIEVR
jgi:HSP20 family molecular chaperone IbpA